MKDRTSSIHFTKSFHSFYGASDEKNILCAHRSNTSNGNYETAFAVGFQNDKSSHKNSFGRRIAWRWRWWWQTMALNQSLDDFIFISLAFISLLSAAHTQKHSLKNKSHWFARIDREKRAAKKMMRIKYRELIVKLARRHFICDILTSDYLFRLEYQMAGFVCAFFFLYRLFHCCCCFFSV